MRRASLGLLLAAALLVWAPCAWARSTSQDGDFEGTASGQIVLTWHGDPARGCAAAGVCDLSGSIVSKPDLVDIYGAFRPDGRFYPGEATLFSTAPAVVRTRRSNPTGASSTCLDLVDAGGVALSPTEQPGGRYTFDLSTAHSFTDGLTTGRCAGPKAKQLETVFPSGVLQAALKGHRSRLLDLTGRRSFTAGPFSGEVVSTLAARLWPYRYGDESDDSSSDGSEPHSRTIRLVGLAFEYRVESMAGSLVTAFNGSARPFCVPFDSCGLSGTSSYSTSISHGDLVVGGLRVLRRGEQASRRSTLRELRAGRLGISGDSVLPDGALAQIASTVHYADGSSCGDSGETTPLAGLEVAHARRAAHFVLGGSDYERGTLLRSNCQGPIDDDVIGATTPLATGSVPVGKLGAKSLEVKLAAAGRFSTGAYTGTRTGEIALHLVRTSVHFRVQRVKVTGGLFGP